MHESPIVNTPEDAVKTFQQGNLDALAIGPYIALREKQPQTSTMRQRPATASA